MTGYVFSTAVALFAGATLAGLLPVITTVHTGHKGGK